MALVYESGYDYISVIGSRQIKFRQWTAKEERNYLSLIEKESEDFNDKTIFNTLIKPCIEEKDVVLSAAEQKKLLIDIRIKSIGDTFKDKITCSNCGKESEVEINLDEIMKYMPSTFKDVEVGDIKFYMGPIENNKEKDVLKIKDGIIEYIFNDFLLHIRKIEIRGEVNEGYSFKELKKFTDSLPTSIFDKLFEEYKDMVDEVQLKYNFVCPECQYEEEKEYDDIPDLLWV
jgi:hypothetical protein